MELAILTDWVTLDDGTKDNIRWCFDASGEYTGSQLICASLKALFH
jgi:hypothetical protein